MKNLKRREQKFPQKGNPAFKLIEEFWEKGYFDEYSTNHFIMRCFFSENIDFYGKEQLVNNESQIFGYSICENENFSEVFLLNFAAKLNFFKNNFGEKPTVEFVKNQLAAGKTKYDEDQFFRALSEFNVLNYFSNSQSKYSILELIYEPKLGINGANPEARIVYNDDIVVDIEVKTPGFIKENYGKNKLIPTVLLSEKGKNESKRFEKEYNIKVVFPRVNKIVDYLNSAAKKFEIPKTEKHLNLLVINWSYSDFESNSYLEALGILYNDLTGILKNKDIALELGVKGEVFDKLSAVLIYSDTAESFMLNNLSYLTINSKYSLISLSKNLKLLNEITSLKVVDKDKIVPRILANINENSKLGAVMSFKYMKEIIEKYRY